METLRNSDSIFSIIQSKTGVEIDTTYRTEYIDTWREWFQGNRTGFHEYTEKVLGVNKSFNRLSLGAAGKTARAWTELLTREFPIIAIEDQGLQDKVEVILKKENFKEEIVKYLELAFGVGTSCMVQYINGNEIYIDFLDVDYFVPLSWRNGLATEIATINIFKKDDKYYTHIQYNLYTDGNYVLENQLFQSEDKEKLGDMVDPIIIGIEDMVFSGVKPFFQIMKPNITNKIDIDSPLGMSVFQDSIDTVASIDRKYTEFDSEFCLGKKRIIVSSDALKKKLDTDTGQWVSYLGSDTIYQAVNSEDSLFQTFDPQLRDASYINALNQEFNFLADSIGMDAGTFVFNGTSMKTATEVISEKSKTFGTKQKHDKMLKQVLYNCVWSIIHCIEAIEGRRYDTTVTITMSDSVLIDSQAKKADERIDVQSNLMPKTEYLMRNYGLSEEEAKEWVVKANEEQGTVTSETLEGMFR